MRCLVRYCWLGRQSFKAYSTAAHAGHGVVLRPYQEACLEACLDALNSGSTRIGVSLPTGAGKTTVFISLLSRISPPAKAPDATRALVIVNSIELALQAAAQAAKLFPQWSVEIEQGPKHHASGLADITVATYQTLLQHHRLHKFKPSGLKAVIVDEAHHAAAPSYLHILSHFNPAIKHPASPEPPPAVAHSIPILGFSATFSRHDGLALGSVFEQIVYHRDFLEMIKEQWLCNVRFTCVHASIDLSKVTVQSRTGDFNPTSLAHVINTPTVNNLVVQTWLDRAAERKSTLVFCVNLAHLRDLTEAFRKAGIDARYVYSGTPATERRALIASFKAGAFPVLLNCAVLTEGADIPNIDCVVVARPTRSRNLFAQMIGRGMRLSPGTGKEDCRVIDFVDSNNRVAGVISTPTLFGLDPGEIIDDETTESLEERSNSIDEDPIKSTPDTSDNIPDPKSVTYIDHDNPFSFVDQASGAPHIAKLSPFAWVGCGDDVYVLECMNKGFVRIEPIPGSDEEANRFRAHHVPPTMPSITASILKISPFRRSDLILEAPTLEAAIRGCETYILKHLARNMPVSGLLRTAKWRREPATDGQKQFIQRRWQGRAIRRKEEFSAGSPDLADRIHALTKGSAANIITRLKHGAQSRYEKKLKAAHKVAQSLAREEQRKAREHVKVGPLPGVH